MQTNDIRFIREVNQLARINAQKGLDPFAALLVQDGQIKASTADQCVIYSDPTAHAELSLISEYCRANHLISLEGYTLYANVEPCVMCSGAIHWARISRVIFGLSQEQLQSKSGGKLKPSAESLINIGNKTIEVIGPILPEEGIKVFQEFPFQSKKARQTAYLEKQQATNDPALFNDFYCAQVIGGKVEVEIIWESANVLAFHHTQPYWEHHVVVIPKRHIETIIELNDHTIEKEMLEAIRFVANKMRTDHGGCRVCSNVGTYQSTKHLHFYLHTGKRLRKENGEKIIE